MATSMFPKSRQEAQSHINEIQQRHHKYIGEEWIQLVTESMGEKQYSNDDRFFFELLQNADDNYYADATPWIKLHLGDKYLLIQSNEVGFTRANVDSICRLAMSSKSHKDDSILNRNTIGEKGLGFKAVFSVAIKVWIKSGHYSFRFDRDAPLGRIYPNWVDTFPKDLTHIEESGLTSIVLELVSTNGTSETLLPPKPPQRTKLVDLLSNLSPDKLLFLSKLKSIDIDIERRTGPLLDLSSSRKTALKIEQIPNLRQALHVVHAFKNEVKESYIVYRYPVSKLPEENNRPGCRDSEIILAFHLPITAAQSLSASKVYAFLPIKDYGFKFLIHADFILSTNREEVQDNEWNRRLIEETAIALTEVVLKSKQQSSELWYKWPLLVPFDLPDSIFRSVQQCMINTFRANIRLENVKGHDYKPDKLVWVSSAFSDKTGSPLIPHEYCNSNRVSKKYPMEVETSLKKLGVHEQTETGFLKDLEDFTKNHLSCFRDMTESWHQQLCRVLLNLINKHKSLIKSLPIILLADRKTLVSSNLQLYFGDCAGDLSLPSHMNGAREVDSSCRLSERGQLYSDLGVVDGSRHQLCRYVLEENKGQIPLSTENMVAQIRFLFQADWNPVGGESRSLRFKTSSEKDALISDMYVQSDAPYTASTLSKKWKNSLNFIHPAYLEAFPEDSPGYIWLVRTFELRSELRVVSYESDGKFHRDFIRLFNKDPLAALDTLRSHWPLYRSHFERRTLLTPLSTGQRLTGPDKLKRQLSKTAVPCLGGAMSALRETYLPNTDMLAICDAPFQPYPGQSSRSLCRHGSVSDTNWQTRDVSGSKVPSDRLIDIQNPNDKSWCFLETFGVTTKPGAQMFIDYLRLVRGKDVSHDDVDRLYGSLESIMDGPDRRAIRAFFNEPQSVYVPNSPHASAGSWRDLHSCVWQGPSCLKKTTRLAPLYERRWHLFKSLAPPVNLGTLEREAMHLQASDRDHVESLMMTISEYLTKETREASPSVPTFENCRMFPVISNTCGNILRSVADLKSNPWFIADNQDLNQAFSNVVDLCDIPAEAFEQIQALTDHLRLQSRFLSKLCTRKTIIPNKNECQEHESYANLLRSNAKFISQLAPSTQEILSGYTTEQLLARIKVLKCNHIAFQWTLQTQNQVFKSRVEDGVAALAFDSTSWVLEAYVVCPNDELQHGYTPFELYNELIKFLNITDKSDAILLTRFMGERNHNFIEKDLERRNRRRKGLGQPFSRMERVFDGSNFSYEPSAAVPTDLGVDETESHILNVSPEDVHTTHSSPSTTVSQLTQLPFVQAQDTAQSILPHGNNISYQPIPGGQSPVPAFGYNDKAGDGNKATSGLNQVSDPTIMRAVNSYLDPAWSGTEVETKYDPPAQSISKAQAVKDGVLPLAPQAAQKTSQVTPDDTLVNVSEGSRSATDASTHGNEMARPKPPQRENKNMPNVAQAIEPKAKGPTLTQDTEEWWVIPSNDFQAQSEGLQDKPDEPRQGFVDLRCGIMYNYRPKPMFIGDDTQDTMYYGELYVCRFLASILGPDSFDPDRDWTSPMRSRQGQGLFSPKPGITYSSFTIEEAAEGTLREFMSRDTELEDFKLSNPCTFHIQVCTTNYGLDTRFDVAREQYKKAKSMCLQLEKTNKEVYILARVYNLRSDWSIAFYVDPWQQQQQGTISLESPKDYVGKVLPTAPKFLYDDCWITGRSLIAKQNIIYCGLEIKPTQIRLLRLEIDDDDKPLRAQLVRADIESDVRFWAISYVWGPNPAKHGPMLEVNKNVQVPITESLSACLTTLRHQKVTVLIWADAICINQNDDIEKAIQVRRMGAIYSKAEQVMIWLGHGTKNTLGAERSLQRLERILEQSEGALFKEDSEETALAESINSLLRRDWFSRTWIVQELVFGSKVTVMHGNHRVEWEHLIGGIVDCDKMIRRKLGMADDPNQTYFTDAWTAFALHDIREQYKGSSAGTKSLKYSLLELIERLFPTRSSRPRDKLFALLNLAHDTSISEDSFSPDYTGEDSVILYRFASEFVKADHALDLLCHAGEGKGSGFCSWVPDLMNSRMESRYPPTISTWEAAGYGKETRFSAGAPLPCDAKVMDAGSITTSRRAWTPVLSLKGIMFDTVKSCRSLDMSYGGSANCLPSSFISFRNLIKDLFLRHYEHAGENWKDSLVIKCLIGDAIGPYDPTSQGMPFNIASSAAREKWARDFESSIIDMHPGHDAQQYAKGTQESLRIINDFWQTASAFLEKIPGAKICVTEKGYVGIVPGAIAVGDEIFIPHSSRTPFVVRKSVITSKYYYLVGESYIHGIMYYEESPVRGSKEVVIHLT